MQRLCARRSRNAKAKASEIYTYMVDRVHRHRNKRRCRASFAVGNFVLKRLVDTSETSIGSVLDRAIWIDHCGTMDRIINMGYSQNISIIIRVIVQDRDINGNTFIRGTSVIQRGRTLSIVGGEEVETIRNFAKAGNRSLRVGVGEQTITLTELQTAAVASPSM